MVKQQWIYLIIVLLGLSYSRCRSVEKIKPNIVFDSKLSFTQNPANNWQVGYSNSDLLDTSQFLLATFADTTHSIRVWHPSTDSSGYYPYVGQNKTGQSQLDISNMWALRPGQIAMEASNSGKFSILRFISPIAGSFHVKAVFEGVHFGLSTTDVHVLLNDIELFKDIIEGYGGDSTYHRTEGLHPTTTYDAVIILKKGDLLTFAVGYGNNKNHFNDTTGLEITVENT